jgi:hypothetical protein
MSLVKLTSTDIGAPPLWINMLTVAYVQERFQLNEPTGATVYFVGTQRLNVIEGPEQIAELLALRPPVTPGVVIRPPEPPEPPEPPI